MYGKPRFLIDNHLEGNLITPSSQATGRLSGVTTSASGSASWQVTGNYSGAIDKIFTVVIDDTSGGYESGTSTFSWKTSSTTSGWEATGVTTSTTSILLEDGVYINWLHGTGHDFEEGDTGTFWGYASFGRGNLLDFDRNTYWLSTGYTDETLTIDYGEALQDTVLVIADHNISASATVTFMRNTANSWGSPAYSQALTVTDPMVLYFNDTHQFSRIRIQDASNPDGYIKIAELYLGTYTELAAIFGRQQWGSSIAHSRRMVENEAETGRRNQRIWSVQRVFDLDFDVLDNTDEPTLYDVWQATFNTSTGQVLPLFVHYFNDEPTYMMLCRILADYTRTYRSFGINRVAMRFEEVAKTR